jgi:hypothetical protein
MEDSDWKALVVSLVDAKRSLSSAWQVLDGTDGAAPGAEHALTAALSAIDAIYGIEADNAANEDVAAPVEVQPAGTTTGSCPASRSAAEGSCPSLRHSRAARA